MTRARTTQYDAMRCNATVRRSRVYSIRCTCVSSNSNYFCYCSFLYAVVMSEATKTNRSDRIVWLWYASLLHITCSSYHRSLIGALRMLSSILTATSYCTSLLPYLDLKLVHFLCGVWCSRSLPISVLFCFVVFPLSPSLSLSVCLPVCLFASLSLSLSFSLYLPLTLFVSIPPMNVLASGADPLKVAFEKSKPGCSRWKLHKNRERREEERRGKKKRGEKTSTER